MVCTPLTNNIKTRTRDTSRLLDIIDLLNSKTIPGNTIIVSFDIVNMYPSIGSDRGIAAVRNALDFRTYKTRSTDHIILDLEICLKCNNSKFGWKNLLLLNGTATVAANSSLYADLAVLDIDKNILLGKRNTYQEMRSFGQYYDDFLALFSGPLEKLELIEGSKDSKDSNLQFAIEFGEGKLCFLDLKLNLKD